MKKKIDLQSFLLRIMRLTLVQIGMIILFTSIGFARKSNAQEILNRQVSLHIDNQDIKSILSEVEQLTSVKFMYSSEIIQVRRRVSFLAKNEKLSSVLDRLLSPLKINYEVSNKKILLTSSDKEIEKQQSSNTSEQLAPLAWEITGIIKNASGEPIPSVTIREEGTNNGTVSNADGKYTISVKNGQSTLLFSMIGYVSTRVPVGTQKVINVSLVEDNLQLGEVVVIGYGTQKKSEITTATATVKAKDFNQGVVRDASELIKGKIAGLSISNGSGDPLAGPSVSLRGIASLQGSSAPLILINGVPGSFDSVAPNDIASVDVLKDASASAIYGTRGANGVILITTKSAEKDMPNTLSYSFNIATSSFAKKADFLNASGLRSLLANNVKMPFVDEGYATDWLSEISRKALIANHNLNFKGGSAKSNYVANINYGDQQGVFLDSYNKELKISFDMNHYMFNDKLKFNFNIVRGTYQTGAFDGNIYRQALIRNPTARPKDDNGDWTQTRRFQYSNPLASIVETDQMGESAYTRITGGLTLTLLPGWVSTLTVSSLKNTSFNGSYETKKNISNVYGGKNGVATVSNSKNSSDILEATSRYSKAIGKHDFSVLGGYSYQYNVADGSFIYNYDFPTDAFTYNNIGAGNALKDGTASMGSSKSDDKLIGFFGRASYGFDNRFHLLASIRNEGSSKFGNNNKWGLFPAVSAGWTISNEPFMKNVRGVNNLKLRAGYGETGVIVGGSYLSQTLLKYEGDFYDNGKWVKGLVAASNPNPDLRWEKSQEVNIGIDFSFLKNRINGSIDLYNKQTKDMLWEYSVPQPPNLYGTTLANVGKMENKGIEILLNGSPVRTNSFEWNTSLTFSHNQNKLLSLSNDLYKIEGDFLNVGDAGDPISFSTHRLEVGQPIGNFWGLKSVDITDDGKWIIETADGTRKTLTPDLYGDDKSKQYLGNGIPSFRAGWTNYIKYKNFDISVQFNGAFGFQILNGQRMFYENPNINYNMLTTAQDKIYGKTKLNYSQTYVSYYIEDGDYVKIDNASIGYNLNTKKIPFIKSMRLFVSGTNLATFTKYKGIDPEIAVNDLRTPGFDNRDKYPTVRTFTLGVNVNF